MAMTEDSLRRYLELRDARPALLPWSVGGAGAGFIVLTALDLAGHRIEGILAVAIVVVPTVFCSGLALVQLRRRIVSGTGIAPRSLALVESTIHDVVQARPQHFASVADDERRARLLEALLQRGLLDKVAAQEQQEQLPP